MDEFGFVAGSHDHELGQAAEIGEIKRARMRRAVGADKAGAVHGETHRQLLDRDVVDDLIICALQEGRVDRTERLITLGRQTAGKRHRMLLGDADVESAVGKGLAEKVDAGAGRHGGGNGDDLVVRSSLP